MSVLTWGDIGAWAGLMRLELRPLEVSLLKFLDAALVATQAKELKQ